MLKKYALSITLICVFSCVGLCVASFRGQAKYFFMFAGMGSAAAFGEWITVKFPKYKQVFRRTIQALVGGFLFIGLSLYGNVNFQFSELFFDLYAGVVTGALIQLVFARLILPFFMGNAFCSRACWNGAMFELAQPLNPKIKKPKVRSEVIAVSYICLLIIISTIVSYIHNPAIFEASKRYWIIGENIVILSIGIVVSRYWGSRTYCRTFCPFITISGLFSKYSIFKITPIDSKSCNSCGLCNKNCPMLVDVRTAVKANERIKNKSCILCERCVDACPKDCINLSADLPWK